MESIPPLDVASFWNWATRFGQSGVLLPMALLLAAWLAVPAKAPRQAAAWMVAFCTVVAITTASKIAFLGFGIGIASLDFTGFSGHAMFSASVYPMIGYAVTANAGQRTRLWTLAAGYAVAVLIMVSRLEVHAHSVAEATTGFLLGAGASAFALWRLGPSPRRALPALLAAGIFAWLAITPQRSQEVLESHRLVTQLALKLSGRSTPYTREDLHRRSLEGTWSRRKELNAPTAKNDLAALPLSYTGTMVSF